MAPFKFDKDFHNHEQVRHLMPAYQRRYDELLAAKQYPYNDSFKGYLGADFASPPDEDAAIYLCQRLRRLDDLAVRVTAARAEGFEPVKKVDGPIRGSVIHYGFYMGGRGFRRWDDVRLVAGRGFLAVQRPRQRTRGVLLVGGHVLVKARARVKAASSGAAA